ncbi:MAG: polyphosphate kinase 2 family protein [Methylacidiphilales bacterium]|nr:polyphosphate kinase 2 family protein [Candidatus Methylacidiphilales bacterium]
MKLNRKKIAGFAHRYRADKGSEFQLKDIDPGDTPGLKSDEQAQELLAAGIKIMAQLQEKLYAQERWSLLLIFQAMDAAGKDGTIKHVMSGVNPQGCEVTSFKTPSPLDLRHDFLWRSGLALPERGKIGIFNRSYYEEVLVIRVHREFLKAQKIPEALITKHIWKERFEDINAYERHLARNGVIIRKFFLHISKSEQKRRFLARVDEPAKNWKFSAADLKERAYWDEYMEAYEEMIRHTSTDEAPWYVVPANDKRFARLVVAAAIIETLDSLNLEFPKVTSEQRHLLDEARQILKS